MTISTSSTACTVVPGTTSIPALRVCTMSASSITVASIIPIAIIVVSAVRSRRLCRLGDIAFPQKFIDLFQLVSHSLKSQMHLKLVTSSRWRGGTFPAKWSARRLSLSSRDKYAPQTSQTCSFDCDPLGSWFVRSSRYEG